MFKIKEMSTIDKLFFAPTHLFIAKSKRRVEGKDHVIGIVIEASEKYANSLRKNKRSRMTITGYMKEMDDEISMLRDIWKHTEKLHIRPFAFVVTNFPVSP